jgi:flagellar basal-body rod modification protein FlgD
MAISSIPATTTPSVTSAVTPAGSTSTGSNTTANTTGIDSNTIAGNFQTFLTLLTTQLKNQNPLDPLDTNQFTQQLVQFAQVEQQLKGNEELGTLVSLQQTAQQTTALDFVGQTVAVDGNTAPLTNGQASWNLAVPKPATGAVTITSSTGQTVYTGNYQMDAGTQPFVWDGKDNNGLQWPDGNYTLSVTAQDASGQPVAVPTEIDAVVDSADLTQSPPTLSVAGQNYTLDKIRRIIRN